LVIVAIAALTVPRMRLMVRASVAVAADWVDRTKLGVLTRPGVAAEIVARVMDLTLASPTTGVETVEHTWVKVAAELRSRRSRVIYAMMVAV
jgi:hypothetical protein